MALSTYLENVPRVDALNFDSTKCTTIYIACSEKCCRVAEQDAGQYQFIATANAVVVDNKSCYPNPIDVSFGFGVTKSLEEELSELQQEAEEGTALDKASRKIRAKAVRPQVVVQPSPVEKKKKTPRQPSICCTA